MSADPLQENTGELRLAEQSARTEKIDESRLLEIRREAENKGTVQTVGIRPPGAPFPIASPETGYYGIHMLKEPQWTPEIPAYFFIGGAAGAAATLGAIADWTGLDDKIARDARWVTTIGALASSALLISDLGRPSRFLNMLRMFKPQSPMSMGAWTLAAFGTFSGANLVGQLAQDYVGPNSLLAIFKNGSQALSMLFGLPLHNYTGVLIGATAIPVWNHNIRSLPIHFGTSGLLAGTSILELMGSLDSTALNLIGIGAATLETYEGYHLERKRDPVVNRPLKRGTSGWITRAGGVLSGPVPLALRLAALAMGSRRGTKIRRVAAWSGIVGSICTRYGWVRAGAVSARDYRLPLEIRQPKVTGELEQLQSKPEMPQAKVAV
jgi:Polysulphide reductase, NrfD